MSFFEELKRRNVFRVGIAYAITAWVLIQALDIFLPTFGAPEWVMKVVSLLFLAGLPVALIFSWVFEMTPDGVKREKDVDRSSSITPSTGKKLNTVIISLMAIALAFLLYERFSIQPRTPELAEEAGVEEPIRREATEQEAELQRRSIAVLPFDNRSNLEADAFFVDGVHDDLLTNLARIGSLKVISRTSVTKYRGTEMSIPEIASELGVASVMEGAVQRSGDTVRINVQLIDAQTDEHLWAEIFDREMTAQNLFAIQSEISQKIAEALKTTLSPEEQQRINARPTENLAAYNAYLRGRLLLVNRASDDIDRAADEFKRAVELDPDFALAWVGVADAAAMRVSYSDMDPMDSLQQRRAATERALALNDRLGEAHLAKATLLEDDELYPEAEVSFLKAIELSPNYATAHHWYSNFLDNFPHRYDEALTAIRKAEALDPASLIIKNNVGFLYRRLGRFDEAESQVLDVMQLEPRFTPAMILMADLMADVGRVDEQILWQRRSIEADPGRVNQYVNLMWAYFDLADTESVAKIRAQMEAVNEEHVFTGFADLAQSMYIGNIPAAQESADWVFNRLGRPPWMLRILGFLHNMARDYPNARANFEASNPSFFRPDKWRTAIEDEPYLACMVGFVLLKTEDTEMGYQLIDDTISYLEEELPGYVEHADRFGIEWCYMARSETDKALAALETVVEHRHFEGWWFMRKHPQWEPLWGDPRFEGLMTKIEADVARQRENLANAVTGATL